MHSPWHADGFSESRGADGNRQRDTIISGGAPRGSLGQLIERSTSAPPPSSDPSGDSLLGNDLLEHMTRGYADTAASQAATPLIANNSTSHAYSDAALALLNTIDNSGRATAPSTTSTYHSVYGAGNSNTRHLSSGHAVPGKTQDERQQQFRLRTMSASMLDDVRDIERSQSAAPTLPGRSVAIGPPPGWSNLSVTHGDPLARSVSTPASISGLGNAHGALRPSPRTAMDLIQEDGDRDVYGNVTGHRGTYMPPRQPGEHGVNVQHQYRQRDNTPVPIVTQRDVTSGRMMQGLSLQDSSNMLPPHYIVQADSGRKQQPSPDEVRQPSLYASVAPQQHTILPHPPPQQNQQVFYGGQQQRLEIHPASLQAQVLPNGQTVYVNAPTQPASYQYNATTMQYHPTQQQHQIIHPSISVVPGRTDQYVSVLPVQNGTQLYWQSEVAPQQQQQTLTPQVRVVNSPPLQGAHHQHGIPLQGAQHAINGRLVPTPTQTEPQSPGYGRHREAKPQRERGRQKPRRGGESKVASPSLSSAVLDEFRSTKNRDWSVRQIEGHVVEFCQDQNGSRFIQQRLELGDLAEQQIVMREILPAIRRLRNDVFGNYVVQKLLDFGTPSVKAEIRGTLEGEMLPLSLQMYGCRVVQKALEALDEDDLPRLLVEFHHNVLSCIHDQNGNHVIQKCIEVVNGRARKAQSMGDLVRADFLKEQVEFVVDDVLVNTTSLSCHPYGCRVLQRILEHCDEMKKIAVLDEISKCHKRLLDDQYGNYVIQHVLQFGRQCDRDSILQIVVEQGLLRLSRQKFASNVVEKLLKYGNAPQRRAIVREMLKSAEDPASPNDPAEGRKSVVLLMVRDAYANYVVQTTLDVVPKSEEQHLLLVELNAHAEELRNYTFAKHIVAKLTTINNSKISCHV